MRNNLKVLRQGKRWTQEEAAAAVGMSLGGYRKLEYGENQLTTESIRRLAEAYGVTEADVVAGEPVAIVGLAGAGPEGTVEYLASGDLGEAPRPPGAGPKTVALESRGNSMRGIAEDGWLIYYDDRREPVTDDLLGELCVIGLRDGRTLVKTLYRGRARGLYDLESTNAPTMRDVEVEWAARVSWIMPRATARKLVRGAA